MMEPIESQKRPFHVAYCTQCKRMTPHHHLHDTAHGLAGTHMAGSERYECTFCHTAIHRGEEGDMNRHLHFLYDED